MWNQMYQPVYTPDFSPIYQLPFSQMSLIEVSTPPSWSELRQTVRDVRSHFSSRGTRTPSGEIKLLCDRN